MFSVSVHPSGEVACSGGEDDKARVWKVTDETTLFVCEGKYYYTVNLENFVVEIFS